jgi:hypothetical protein
MNCGSERMVIPGRHESHDGSNPDYSEGQDRPAKEEWLPHLPFFSVMPLTEQSKSHVIYGLDQQSALARQRK